MREFFPFFLSASFLLVSLSANAELYPHFPKEIKKMAAQHGVKLSDLGAKITTGEADNLEVIFEQRIQDLMIPASVTKIATASAVLSKFPPGHKFKTQLLSAASVQNGVLKGALFLKGGGDPAFVSENMWYLVNAFTRSGIIKVEGDIVVDDTLFDKMRYDVSRQDKRVDNAYDAPVGAMSFNWNSVNIFVRPTSVGEKAQVFVDPENDYIKMVNNTKTSSGGENKLIVDRSESKDGDVIRISGSVGKNLPEVVVFRNITKPDLWAGANLKSFLKQRGIEVTGSVKTGETASGAKLYAESESKPIEQHIADMNKFSNNYVSEMLTKNLASTGRKPATLADGMKVVNEHLQSLGVKEKEISLQSPSGLTHDNKMSPQAAWMILRHLRNDFQVQPEFLSSLPIAGIDGTLKRRMRNGPAERWVRAKTGYVNNVVSLAGYAGRRDGKVLTFSLIYNGSTNETKVRSFFDEVLTYLVQ